MLAAALLRRSLRPSAATRSLSAAPTLVPRWLLFYDYVPDVLEKRQPHRAGHIALVREYVDRGDCLLGGAFADPVDGAVIVFSTEAAANGFAEADPYVANGIVTSSKVREWSTVEF